jgi:hypothetical protein
MPLPELSPDSGRRASKEGGGGAPLSSGAERLSGACSAATSGAHAMGQKVLGGAAAVASGVHATGQEVHGSAASRRCCCPPPVWLGSWLDDGGGLLGSLPSWRLMYQSYVVNFGIILSYIHLFDYGQS